MDISLQGRSFQFWEYTVSHGQLLVRSPRVNGFTHNIDVCFYGVEYAALPRFLDGIAMEKPNVEEVRLACDILRKEVIASKIFVLSANQRRHVVIAAKCLISQSTMDIFESPFQIRS
jgi:hypothetical protein